jgi:hypothetical protein
MSGSGLVHSFSVALASVLAAPGVEYGGPGWYLVELESGQRLTLKVLAAEDDTFTASYQGLVLELPRARIESLESLRARWRRDPASAPMPAEDEERVREAIEDMSGNEKDRSLRSYDAVRAAFPACRPLVHECLKHRAERARTLLVKLLGEHGEAGEDLDPIEPLLRDPDDGVRLAAVFAVRALVRDDPGAIPRGRELLVDHLAWEPVANIRKVTVKSLERWKDAAAVAALVSHLERETDRGVKVFVANALKYLTKKDYGTDPRAWGAYLARRNVLDRAVKR